MPFSASNPYSGFQGGYTIGRGQFSGTDNPQDMYNTHDPLLSDKINKGTRSRQAINHYADDYEDYRKRAAAALGRNAYDVDPSVGQVNDMLTSRDAQQGFTPELYRAMMGATPSAAQIRGRAEQDRAVAQGMGAISSGAPPGQSLRAALGAAGQAGVAANANAVAQRSAEIQKAQGAYQDFTKGIQKNDLDSALEQQRLNFQLASMYEGYGSDMLTQQALAAQAYDRMMNEQLMNKQKTDYGYYESQQANRTDPWDIFGAVANAGGQLAGQYFGRKGKD